MKEILKWYREIIIAVLLIATISLTIVLIIPPIQRAINRVNNYGTYDVVKNTKTENFDLQNLKLADSISMDEERLVFFGDSITEIAPFNDMYPYKNATPDHVYNRGISGDTVKSMRDRLTNVTTLKPTILVILIGTNDLGYGGTTEEITGYLGEVIDDLLADGIENNYQTDIYIQSVMPVNETREGNFNGLKRNTKIKELNTSYAQLCESKNVSFVDTYNDFIDDKGNLKAEFTYDGLHPNSVGYYHMREVLETKIFSTLR